MLSVEQLHEVLAAATVGGPDPVGTDESRAAYSRFMDDIDAVPDGMAVSIPGEVPDLDDWQPYENDVHVAEGYASAEDFERLMEGFDPLKHPRGKDGKFIHSGVKTSHWSNSKSPEWAKKKIYYFSAMAAQGNWSAIEHDGWTPKEGTKLNTYQKAVVTAKANLLAMKNSDVLTPPTGTKPSAKEPAAVTIGQWENIGPQLGSNPGGTYIGPNDQKYYVKHPKNPVHAKAEVLSAKLIEHAGGHVVDAELVEVHGKTSIATKWVDGSNKVDWDGDPTAKQSASDDFALHAWLANWDVIGATSDPNNMLKHGDKVVAVDVGGSLMFRAQGGSKKFDGTAGEWESMRTQNTTGNMVFGGMTSYQLGKAASKLHAIDDATVAKLVDKYHDAGMGMSKAELTQVLKQRKETILAKAADDIETYKAVNETLGIEVNIPKSVAKPVDAPKAADAQKPADAPASVPPKIHIGAAKFQYLVPTVDAIHAAAMKGDVDAVLAVKTNGTTVSTYPKKVHAYKLQVAAAMKGGGKVNADHIEPPKPAAAKVKPKRKPEDWKPKLDELPKDPEFISSKPTVVETKAAAAKVIAMAKAGDIDGLEKAASTLPPSPKLMDYHKTVLATLKAQKDKWLNPPAPPEPPKPLSGAMLQAATKVHVNKYASPGAPVGMDVHGYWVIHGEVGTHGLPSGGEAWHHQNHHAELQALGAKKRKEAKVNTDHMSNYTGPAYQYNNPMRSSEEPKHVTEAKAEWNKTAVELPAGLTIGRRYDGPDPALKLKPGQLITDAAFVSTSTSKTVWSGNVHMRIRVAPGAKGVPIAKGSSYKSEEEVILGPHAKFLVEKIESIPPAKGYKAADQHILWVTLLPDNYVAPNE